MEKQSKVDLVGVGLNATDTVIPLSTYPARGSKTEYSTISTLPGGQVATTVVACQQWPLSVRPICEVLPGQMITLALAAQAGREAGRFERATKITTTE